MSGDRLPVHERSAWRCIPKPGVDRKTAFFGAFVFCLISVAGIAADVQVNLRDHEVSNKGFIYTVQNEPSVAVSGSLVVVGYNSTRQAAGGGPISFQRRPHSTNGYAFSTDGGMTFTDGGFVPEHGHQLRGDPALAFSPNGAMLYYASIGKEAVKERGKQKDVSRIFVSPSKSLSPVEFGAPIAISGTVDGATQDKELIAVDTTESPFRGRVYVAWSEFPGNDEPFGLSRILLAASKSTNPLEFLPAQSLTTPAGSPVTENSLGAMPAVAPNGDVYVVWSVFTFKARTDAAPQTIQIVQSKNGGAKFQNPDPADAKPSKTIADVISTVGRMCNATPGTTTCPRGLNIRTRGFPHIAIDHTPSGSPTHGNIYVVFQAKPLPPEAARSQIFFTRSTDHGKTWDAPRSISNGPAVTLNGDTTQNDNWQPSIAVSPTTGHIRVIFYSRREDPTDNINIRVYDAGSSDGGLTWFNRPRSEIAFRPSTGYDDLLSSAENRQAHMGDYISVVASGSNFYAAWTDTRNKCTPPSDAPGRCTPAGRGDQDIFFSTDADPPKVAK